MKVNIKMRININKDKIIKDDYKETVRCNNS